MGAKRWTVGVRHRIVNGFCYERKFRPHLTFAKGALKLRPLKMRFFHYKSFSYWTPCGTEYDSELEFTRTPRFYEYDYWNDYFADFLSEDIDRGNISGLVFTLAWIGLWEWEKV